MKLPKLIRFEAPDEPLADLPAEAREALTSRAQWSFANRDQDRLRSTLVHGEAVETMRAALAGIRDVVEVDETAGHFFVVTSASEAFDGFGTLNLGPCEGPVGCRLSPGSDGWRLAAIPHDNRFWQMSHYASGLVVHVELGPGGEPLKW